MADQQTESWSLQRFINAVKVSPPWMLKKLLLGVKTITFFISFLAGDVGRISEAPAGAKWALTLGRSSRRAPISFSPLPTSSDVWGACLRAYSATGLWPISFSYPRRASTRAVEAKSFLCPVFPGHAYAFSDENDYIGTYRNYSFALTHKKGGWDCLRHLEILYSGAVPYMPDAYLIPEFTMVHYPTKFLVEVASHVNRSGGRLGLDTRRAALEYFNENLTSAAMARYLLRAVGQGAEPKVLFVDETAVSKPDYQSIFTLIGLKQLLGKKVSVAFPIDYIYDDWNGNSTDLYGRGFGYSRVVDQALKSSNETVGKSLMFSTRSLSKFDLIVVGSLTRNSALAHQLLGKFPASKTIWIHGEDRGPSVSDISKFKELGVTVFARELGDAS